MKPFWMYILRCSDGSLYTGHTDDIERRMEQHHLGVSPAAYTSSRLPVQLVFCHEFPTREEALRAERQVKGWSRAKKLALINGDWAEVSRLAKPRTARSP